MYNKPSRRQFIQAGSLSLLAGSSLAQRPPGEGPGMAPPKSARVTSSVMLWTLHGTVDERLAKVAEAGIQSVELIDEYRKWNDTELKHFQQVLRSYRLGLDVILAPWVSMVNPEKRSDFVNNVSDTIEWAKKLEMPRIIIMSGNEEPGMTHEAQYASLVEGGKRAAELAEKAGAMLILENLNSKVDHKGYFLTSARESLRALKEIGSPHFRMLFDIYHEAVQHGDPIPAVVEAEPYVEVFHVADEPGRHDPGTGQMHWDDIYRAIGKTNYAGIIAFEFRAVHDEAGALQTAVTQMRRDLNAVSEKPSAS